jgi:hypothetical protein
MHGQQINRVSRKVIIILSLTALLTVASGYTQPRHPAPTDEGTAAHIFQLSILAFLPTLLLFLVTADWSRPSRTARPLAIPAAALLAAFAALYCLEHYWFY